MNNNRRFSSAVLFLVSKLWRLTVNCAIDCNFGGVDDFKTSNKNHPIINVASWQHLFEDDLYDDDVIEAEKEKGGHDAGTYVVLSFSRNLAASPEDITFNASSYPHYLHGFEWTVLPPHKNNFSAIILEKRASSQTYLFKK